MGDQSLSRPLQRLIAENADISPIRDALLTEGAAVGPQIATFFTEWERRHAPST
jgi:hypothetical protein